MRVGWSLQITQFFRHAPFQRTWWEKGNMASWVDYTTPDSLAVGMLSAAVAVFCTLTVIPAAPYGRYTPVLCRMLNTKHAIP